MKTKTELLVLAAAAVAVGIVGCRTCGSPSVAPHPRHVVFVGYDGFGSAYVTESVKLPNLRRLMAAGSWTMRKMSALPSSTGVNWMSIFSAAGPEQHGYIGAFSIESAFPPLVTMENGRFPDVFALCREAEPQAKIGHAYEGGRMPYRFDTNSCDFVRQSTKPDEAGIPFLAGEKPRLMAFYFDGPDAAGHKHGWGSPEYNKALEMMDEALGRIVAAIERSGMADDTVLILTADHGGHENSHGQTRNIDMASPLVIWGRGIRKNHQIKASVYSYDIGATMAALLGVKLPQICIGRAVEEVFE